VGTMTIGELATRTGLAPSAIRYYERRGLLPAPARGSGWRRYDTDTLSWLAVIELAKRTGFTLDEIAVLLDAAGTESTHEPAQTWQQLAASKLSEIDARLDQLQQMRALLGEALRCSCLTKQRAELIPAALGWAIEAVADARVEAGA
jgi:MerR family redox-sensitive transcriptional activator SoxR